MTSKTILKMIQVETVHKRAIKMTTKSIKKTITIMVPRMSKNWPSKVLENLRLSPDIFVS